MMHANSRTSEWPQFNNDVVGGQQQQPPQRSTRGFDVYDSRSGSGGFRGHASVGQPAPPHQQPSLSPVHSRGASPVASRKSSLAVPAAPSSPVDLLGQPKRSSVSLPPPNSQGPAFGGNVRYRLPVMLDCHLLTGFLSSLMATQDTLDIAMDQAPRSCTLRTTLAAASPDSRTSVSVPAGAKMGSADTTPE